MTTENGTQELEVQSGDKRIKLRGSDILTAVIGMIVCSGLVYILVEQGNAKAEAKEDRGNVVMAIREFTKAQQDSTREQRVTNCLIALEPQERKGALDRCERIAR